MFIKSHSFSIVLAGKWNTAILNPEWITSNLFDPKSTVEVEFSLNFDMPKRFKIENIIIAPTQDRVVILSNDNTDDSLEKMEKIAIKLCDILIHTPISAVGVNFGYTENQNKENLFPLFEFADSAKLSDDGWLCKTPSIKRSISKDGFLINFVISINNNSDFEFDFNFHHKLNSIKNVKECLENKVVSYKNESIRVLNHFYNLNLNSYE